MVTNYSVANDTRIRKEAASLAAAGASVMTVGYGEAQSVEENYAPYSVVTLMRKQATEFRLHWGSESVWWPVRVTVNTLAMVGLDVASRNLRYSRCRRLFSDRSMVDAICAFDPDVIHCCNPEVGLSVLEAAASCRARLVYDAYELFDGYYHAVRDRGVLQRVADWTEREVVTHSSGALTVSPIIARYLECKYGVADVEVIYNSLPDEPKPPKPPHQPVRILNQAGFRSNTHDHLMVEAMVYLRDVATLTMQGRFVRNDYRDQVVAFIRDNCLDHVVELTGEYDALDGVELAADHDLGVMVFQPENRNLTATLSNRVFTYLSAGLAVAFPNVPAYAQLHGFSDYGLLLDTSSPRSIADGLRELIEQPDRIYRMKQAATAAASLFAWGVQSEKLVKLYRGLLELGEAAGEQEVSARLQSPEESAAQLSSSE